MHVHDEVAWEKLARCLGLLAALDLLHSLGRNEHLKDMIAEFLGGNPLDDIIVDFLFLSGEDMNDEPLFFRCECHVKKIGEN